MRSLNRIYALYKTKGKQPALEEAEKLKMVNNHFYFVLLGELYKEMDNEKAKASFQRAYNLARTQMEREEIQKKIASLKP
jgi:RNA polymerase sigma-70 factor (ECF subfamily)